MRVFLMRNVTVWGLTALIFCLVGTAQAQVDVAGKVFASTLPEQRTVQPGDTASWFATIINSSDSDIHNCRAEMRVETPMFVSFPAYSPFDPSSNPFHFQTTDPATNLLTGVLDTAFDIPAGGSQTLAFFIETDASTDDPQGFPVLDHTENVRVPVDYVCDEGAILPTVVNQPRLTVTSEILPDIIPIALDLDNSGIVHFDDAPFSAVAVAAILANPGDGPFANIVVSANDVLWRPYDHMDTFHAVSELPNLGALICETNPADGTCLADPSYQVVVTFGTDAKTFTVFYELNQNSVVPFLPPQNRTQIDFGSAETTTNMARRFGSTSLAIWGTPAPDGSNDPAWDVSGGFGTTFDQVLFVGTKTCEPVLGGDPAPCKTEMFFDLSDDGTRMLFTYDEHTHGCDEGSNTCEERSRAFWGEVDCVDDGVDGTQFLPTGNWWETTQTCQLNNTQVALDGVNGGTLICALDGVWTIPANPANDWSEIVAPDWGDSDGVTCGGSTHHVGGEAMVAVNRDDPNDPDLNLYDFSEFIGTWSAEVRDPHIGLINRPPTFELVGDGAGGLLIRFFDNDGNNIGEAALERRVRTVARGRQIGSNVLQEPEQRLELHFNVTLGGNIVGQTYPPNTYSGFLDRNGFRFLRVEGGGGSFDFGNLSRTIIKRISTTTSAD